MKKITITLLALGFASCGTTSATQYEATPKTPVVYNSVAQPIKYKPTVSSLDRDTFATINPQDVEESDTEYTICPLSGQIIEPNYAHSSANDDEGYDSELTSDGPSTEMYGGDYGSSDDDDDSPSFGRATGIDRDSGPSPIRTSRTRDFR